MNNIHKTCSHKHTPFLDTDRKRAFRDQIRFHMHLKELLQERQLCAKCRESISVPFSLVIYYHLCILLLMPTFTFGLTVAILIKSNIFPGWVFFLIPLLLWVSYWFFYRIGGALLYVFGKWSKKDWGRLWRL